MGGGVGVSCACNEHANRVLQHGERFTYTHNKLNYPRRAALLLSNRFAILPGHPAGVKVMLEEEELQSDIVEMSGGARASVIGATTVVSAARAMPEGWINRGSGSEGRGSGSDSASDSDSERLPHAYPVTVRVGRRAVVTTPTTTRTHHPSGFEATSGPVAATGAAAAAAVMSVATVGTVAAVAAAAVVDPMLPL